MKRLPAELLLGQLSHNSSDDAVRDVLRQAFVNVDREYIESTMEAIKARIVLREDHREASEDRDRKLRELDLQVKRESEHFRMRLVACSTRVIYGPLRQSRVTELANLTKVTK